MKLWRRERKMMREARKGPYPIHGRTLGYLNTPREPYTWFVCNNGHLAMGSPTEKPRKCFLCGWDDNSFEGWQVANTKTADKATYDTAGGLSGFQRSQEGL